MPPKTPILLLKTKSTPQDGYEDFFAANDYTPIFIPVLEHRFHTTNLARVRELFASGAFNPATENNDTDNVDSGGSIEPDRHGPKYGGMIFTSQRAVEAFVKMIDEEGCMFSPQTPDIDPEEEKLTNINLKCIVPEESRSTPKNIPLYTVGPATARSLSSVRDKYLPSATIHGAEAGNGENLARYILEHYNSLYDAEKQMKDTGNVRKPGLLFLVGEQRRDVIPKMLMDMKLPLSERIGVDEVVVYETGEMGSFEREFADMVERFVGADGGGGADAGGVLWVVVFSPSGCEGMLRVLGLGPFDRDDGADGGAEKRRVFIATIGPTTRDYLRERFGFEADVCAERPSPEGVGEGIRRFMEGLE